MNGVARFTYAQDIHILSESGARKIAFITYEFFKYLQILYQYAATFPIRTKVNCTESFEKTKILLTLNHKFMMIFRPRLRKPYPCTAQVDEFVR